MESLNQSRASDPLYIIASTSYSLEETVVYKANEKGEIIASDEYGCIAKRLGFEQWRNSNIAVVFVFPKKKYYPINDFGLDSGLHQILYRRYDADVDDEYWEWRYRNLFNKQLKQARILSFLSGFNE